jgi:hypothetical protein
LPKNAKTSTALHEKCEKFALAKSSPKCCSFFGLPKLSKSHNGHPKVAKWARNGSICLQMALTYSTFEHFKIIIIIFFFFSSIGKRGT